MWNNLGVAFIGIIAVSDASWAADLVPQANSTNSVRVAAETPKPELWEAGVGEGFRATAHTLSFEAGALQGISILGSRHAHDLALASVSYGHMLGGTVGRDHFYRGNWELRGELFGGAEFAPSREWIVGAAPHLRYDFATGTRLIPYIDAGAGVTATSIGPPDLSNTFEFNLQATAGTHFFLRDNLALTVAARFMHISCAGISKPNLGVNGVLATAGLTFLF